MELDTGFSEGNVGSIPVPNQEGFVFSFKDVYGRLNRKTLSSMPGLQPGVIGAEDIALLVEAFTSFFLPNLEAKISKSAVLSLTLDTNGTITNVSIAQPGFGYPVNQATKTTVNGQDFFDGPAVTVTGDPITGQSLSVANITCKVDIDGRVASTTIVDGGANYAAANAGVAGNTDAGKLINGNIKISGTVGDKTFANAPILIIDPPTATDSDGVLLSSNVTATATVQIATADDLSDINNPIHKGEITEERAKEVKEILILALNHVAGEVGDENFRTLINNNYFNRKGSNFDSTRKFHNGYPISFFSDKTIENLPGTIINRFNNKAIIAQE